MAVLLLRRCCQIPGEHNFPVSFDKEKRPQKEPHTKMIALEVVSLLQWWKNKLCDWLPAILATAAPSHTLRPLGPPGSDPQRGWQEKVF